MTKRARHRSASDTLRLVVVAAPPDAALADRLRAHLRPLERAGLVDLAGETPLPEADLVLPIVSIDFLNGEVAAGAEMRAAVERNRRRIARVLPVVARPCLWDAAPFGDLPPLPASPRAISAEPCEEAVLVEIAARVRDLAIAMRGRTAA